jgi:hypothetical protein
MIVGVIILIMLVSLFVFRKKKSTSEQSGVFVSRSTPKLYPPEQVECGNCHGTGLDGFGIMPDSFKCEACDGFGFYNIDPNAKYIPLSEILKKYDID